MYGSKEEVRITLARKKTELKQIIDLQKANLRATVGAGGVAREQGFVTAVHDYKVLEEMKRHDRRRDRQERHPRCGLRPGHDAAFRRKDTDANARVGYSGWISNQ